MTANCRQFAAMCHRNAALFVAFFAAHSVVVMKTTHWARFFRAMSRIWLLDVAKKSFRASRDRFAFIRRLRLLSIFTM
jgi:hypothetical protein